MMVNQPGGKSPCIIFVVVFSFLQKPEPSDNFRKCRMNAKPKICILCLIFRKENAEFCSLYFELLIHLGTNIYKQTAVIKYYTMQWYDVSSSFDVIVFKTTGDLYRTLSPCSVLVLDV